MQNDYVSEDLNAKVLNCSRLDNISVVSNVERLYFVIYTYKTYDYTWCTKIFKKTKLNDPTQQNYACDYNRNGYSESE